ncbi:MAG: hypothetical protein LBB79_10020 [Prevotellaceae bacterium]|jgi:hypothetical protein|nr:hypothetical protein [Prevotellaceae bacterium]
MQIKVAFLLIISRLEGLRKLKQVSRIMLCSNKEREKYACGFKNIAYFWRELFDSIAPQNAEIRTATNSLPLKLSNSAKNLFFNRLSQTDENLK